MSTKPNLESLLARLRPHFANGERRIVLLTLDDGTCAAFSPDPPKSNPLHFLMEVYALQATVFPDLMVLEGEDFMCLGVFPSNYDFAKRLDTIRRDYPGDAFKGVDCILHIHCTDEPNYAPSEN